MKVLNQNFVKPILNWVTGPKPKTEDTSVLTTADSVELTPQPSQKDEKAQIKAERRRHALRVGSLAAGGAAVIAAAPLLGPAATVGAVLLGTGAVFQSLTGALTASGPGSAGALLVSWFGMGMPSIMLAAAPAAAAVSAYSSLGPIGGALGGAGAVALAAGVGALKGYLLRDKPLIPE